MITILLKKGDRVTLALHKAHNVETIMYMYLNLNPLHLSCFDFLAFCFRTIFQQFDDRERSLMKDW